MAAAKKMFTVINFFMIMKLIAAYPQPHYKANDNTLYPTITYESNRLITPVMKTESKSYAESTANDLAPTWQSTAHNDLTVTKHLQKTDVLQHTTNPIDQRLNTYTKAFIRASLKVFQNELKSATHTESAELYGVLLKIKNLYKPDEALLTKALYKIFEMMNEVNADLTLTESEQTWMETLLERFEQMLQLQQLSTPITDVYESLIIENDIEQNFDVVKKFWLKI